jgi:RAD54-like protein 2
LYKYYTEKESELDLDLPELHQTPTKSKTAAKQSTISSSTSSSLMYQEDGFNPFGAALNDGSRSTNNKNTYDPDWAARLMETYKPNMLENGAKFFLTFSLIEESIKCGDKILLFSQSLLSLDLIEAYLQQLNVVNTNEKWKKYKNYYSKQTLQ